ncbi:hypothetical protein R83H12_00390 [Fibrobacteria bacterium R8-3-H12]
MIKGPIIECEKCNKKYKIGINEFKEGEYTSEEEREMGFEIHYIWQYENNCKFCNNPIIVEKEGCEYPIGSPIEYDNCGFSGCKIIEEPEME